MRRAALTLAAGLLIALAAAPPLGAKPLRSRHLWATVNVCDTLRHPDTIGIRASMPGSPYPSERMYMRFRVQYVRTSDHRWHNIPKGGDSGFHYVGRARYKARQAGQLFVFHPPVGASFEMRGRVTFQWRRGKHVRRAAGLVTTAGHRSTAGTDPPGYSSDTCVIH